MGVAARVRALRAALAVQPAAQQAVDGSHHIAVLEPPVDGDLAQTVAIVEAFKRDGVVVVPNIFSAAECAALRDRIDRLFEAQEALGGARKNSDSDRDGSAEAQRSPIGEYVVQKCYLVDRTLARLFAHPVIYPLMEAIFGQDVQQCGNNSLRTMEGAHRAEQWHVDPPVWFPLPDGIDRHDPRIEMPIFWLTVQIALTDIGPEDGPSQYVLGSHYSGRAPPHRGAAGVSR